jgi:hypothetical protein
MNLNFGAAVAWDEKAVRKLPLANFCGKEHITMFGRPLWSIYQTSNYAELRSLALSKLLCLSQYSPRKFNKRDINHVFAVLSTRVCLDTCMQNTRSLMAATTAVESYLRLVIRMNPDSGLLETASPAEPLLAEAVAYLMNLDSDAKLCWRGTIDTLANDLLRPGLVHKGDVGELAARILLIHARDRLLTPSLSTSSSLAEPIYAAHFSVDGFLHTLFSRSLKKHIPQKFLNGWMNFTHFEVTSKPVRPENMRSLLHRLLLSQTGLQCNHNQEEIDIILPTYLGDPAADFDPSFLSALLLQVKNKIDLVCLKITESKWKRLLSWNDGYELPVVVMQLELGKKPVRFTFKAIESELKNVTGFRAVGADGSIYKSLEEPLFAVMMRQLLEVPITGDEAQEKQLPKVLQYEEHDFSVFKSYGPSKLKDDDINMEAVDESIGEEIPMPSSSNDSGDSLMFGSDL